MTFSRGCDIFAERPLDAPVFPGDIGAEKSQNTSAVSFDRGGISAATEVASRADRIIIAVGDLSGLFLTGTVGEGSDASSLTLPGIQQELVDALLALGKPTVIVLMNGRPYNLGEAFSRANAVIEAWLPGQEGADAIAGILYGDINPSGRLPISIPKSAGAMPYFYNHKLKSAGAPIQPEFGAVYPFGHGLSYTTFRYSDFHLSSATVPIDGEIGLSFLVENTGARPGDEVPQLYVRDVLSSLVRPVKELKGFTKIALAPGERRTVVFTLPVDILGFAISLTKRVVEPGEFEIMVGRSCEDIVFRAKVTVGGTTRELPRRWRMKTDVHVTPDL